MTCSRLPHSDMPEAYRWTLWTRLDNHWEYQMTHRPERLSELAKCFEPSVETLILPPGEHPIEAQERCHR